MPLKTCGRCGKMLHKVGLNVCPACVDAEAADIELVREVVIRNETLSVDQVAGEAGVDIAVVRRIIDEGRVVLVSLDETPRCGKCGAPAISRAKRLCQACLERLNAEVSRAQSQIKLQKKKETQLGAYGKNVRGTFEARRK